MSIAKFNGIHCGYGQILPKQSNNFAQYIGVFDSFEQCVDLVASDPVYNFPLIYSFVYHNSGTKGETGLSRNCHAVISPNTITFVPQSNMVCGLNRFKFNVSERIGECPSCPSCPTCPTCPP